MLKKGEEVKWDNEPSKAFDEIKEATKNAPILRTCYYTKPTHIFSFYSFHTIVAVLL